MINTKWDKRFLKLAREISTWSKDPSSKIGAVIVNDERRILATGYNGFPRGGARRGAGRPSGRSGPARWSHA